MSVKDRNDFFNWHSKQNGLFNFNEELYKYCLSDVEILKNGCLIIAQNIFRYFEVK